MNMSYEEIVSSVHDGKISELCFFYSIFIIGIIQNMNFEENDIGSFDI